MKCVVCCSCVIKFPYETEKIVLICLPTSKKKKNGVRNERKKERKKKKEEKKK